MQNSNTRHPVTRRRTSQNKKPKKKNKKSILKMLILIIFIFIFVVGGGLVGFIVASVRNAPEIDPEMAGVFLNENSFIVDQNGNMIEKILTQEFRTIVTLDEISPHIRNAIVSIEDERFNEHFGIDIKRIIGAFVADIKAGEVVQGASTITQQLVKQLYLTEKVDRNNLIKDLQRKVMEAYLAIQLEQKLSKEQILEAYLNLSPFGQGAYGVQAAAQTYFSKDAKDLTIAESAMIAGVTKSPLKRAIYKKINPEDYNPEKHIKLGEIELLGKNYIAIYNPIAEDRQKTILRKMNELGYISEQEYEEAKAFDILSAVKINPIITEEIDTNYFNDYVKSKVTNDLIATYGYTKKHAQDLIFKGGLTIYATVDLKMQKELEDTYQNFNTIFEDLIYNSDKERTIFVSKRLDKSENIINPKQGNKIVYYKQNNIIDDDGNLYLNPDEYTILDNGDINIKTPKINYRNLDVTDYYSTVDHSLFTHSAWSIDIKKESENNGVNIQNYISDSETKSFTIKSNFLNTHADFITKNGDKLIINKRYFFKDSIGTVQPQSASVVYDYHNGHVKAMIGGRSIEGHEPLGQMLLNRATDSPRQPGSSIKPISVYTAALEQGYMPGTVIDDIPHYNKNNVLWPQNWYGKGGSKTANLKDDFYGYVTVREAIKMSMNVPAVKVLESIGIQSAVDSLTRYHIINPDYPNTDTFVSRAESPNSDEDIAPLSLGGMNYGITPLKMVAAYGTIANQGIYTEPIVYTKVLNSKGEVILENKAERTVATTPQTSYLMTDMLKTVVSTGTATRAQLRKNNKGLPVAGKTGTTQDNADSWFIGFTPYYATATWVGNDNPALKLSSKSTLAKNLWKTIMEPIHKDLEDRDFERPEGIVSAQICSESGKLPSPLCSQDPRGSTVITELFLEGTVPTEVCETHVSANVCTLDGKLATPLTPYELIEQKVFITRPEGYLPEEHQNFEPMDYIYMLPTEFTTLFGDGVQYDEFGNPIQPITHDEFGNPLYPNIDYDEFGNPITDNENSTTLIPSTENINSEVEVITP